MEWMKRVPVRLILAFALLQGLFWLLFYPAFVSPPRPQVDFIPASAFEYAELTSPDADGLSEGDNVKHYLNGKLIAGRGDMTLTRPDYRGNRRTIQHIPAQALQTGENSITAVIAQTTPRTTLLAPPLLSDYSAATSGFAWREFLQSDFHTISVTATLVLALLITVVAWRSTEKRTALWLAMLSASWALYGLIPQWISFPFGGVVRIWALRSF